MNRIVLIAAVALAALTAALPAQADGGPSVKGVVASLSASSVSVKDAHRTVTCAVTASSPSLAGYAEGDRVQAQCRRAAGQLVLAKIRHLKAPGSDTHKTEPVKPSGSEPPKPAVVTTAGGTVTAVSADSLTLHNTEHGDLTCALSSTSPSVAEVHVGDLVKIACKDGVLAVLARPTTAPPAPPAPPPPPAPQPLTTFAGTLTALSSTSLTVHNDEHGDLTCSLADGSPRLGDYHLGDRVKLQCADGVLKLISKF